MTINLHQLIHFIKHTLTAKRRGHGVHSPFAYRLCEEVFYNELSFYQFNQLNQLRKELLNNQQVIQVEDMGAGSRVLNAQQRLVSQIAAKGISTRKQSEIMFRLANFINATCMIELGTSLGLNTLYLASVNSKARLVTIEGSKQLWAFAKTLASKNKVQNCEYINENFDTALPRLLESINVLDFFYVDGNHTYEATLRYFQLGLSKHGPNSVFVFDDIYWSPGMTKAWDVIKKHPSVTLSIDLFYVGLVFFRKEIKQNVSLKLFI